MNITLITVPFMDIDYPCEICLKARVLNYN